MLSKLLSFFKKLFTPTSKQEELDAFISAQHPTCVSDVEYWIGVYDRRQHANGLSTFLSR